MLLENKNAVIYGAAGSIGGAVARVRPRGGDGVPRRPHPHRDPDRGNGVECVRCRDSSRMRADGAPALPGDPTR
jgi:hypothetical protein